MENNKTTYCPFCGGEGILTANYSPKTKLWFINVKCSFCGGTGKYYTQREDPDASGWNTDACIKAVQAWNKRYTPPVEDDDVIYLGTDDRRLM